MSEKHRFSFTNEYSTLKIIRLDRQQQEFVTYLLSTKINKINFLDQQIIFFDLKEILFKIKTYL